MLKALASGLAGAVALTVLHEAARNFLKNAPRVDVTGERGLNAALSAAGVDVKTNKDLYLTALVGDVAGNSLYYSLVALGARETALRNGILLGALAGIGAVLLPPQVGLGKSPTARTTETAALTVAWYTVGGAAAGAVYRATGD